MDIKNILESNGLYEARILSACDYISVPKDWHFILKEDSKKTRKELMLNYWKSFSFLRYLKSILMIYLAYHIITK